MGYLEKMTWTDLRNHGCHLVSIEDLCKTAQTRLIDINQDDKDELYSIRLSGKVRVWGVKESNVIRLLWWDPEHEICPSLLKNT